MKGILIKEFLVNKKQLGLLLAMGAIYLLIGFSSDNAALMTVYIIVVGCMSVLSLFSFDESAKWNTYAAVLPVSRAKIVICRYICAALLVVIGIVIMLVYNIAFEIYKGMSPDIVGNLMGNLMILGGILVMQSIVLPLFYRFGAERARLIMLGVYMLPFAVMLILEYMGKADEFINSYALTALQSYGGFIPVAGLVLFMLSGYISIRMYKKQEF